MLVHLLKKLREEFRPPAETDNEPGQASMATVVEARVIGRREKETEGEDGKRPNDWSGGREAGTRR